MMIFVWALRRGRLEIYFVVRRDVGERLLQESRNIIVEVERKASALDGEHLQRQVPQIHLARFADTFQKLLIVRSAQDRFRVAERIDAIKGNARLGQLIRNIYNVRKDLVLLL